MTHATTGPPVRPEAEGLARFLPIVGWPPAYKDEWLRSDLLSRVHHPVRETLDRGGVTARIGGDHIYRRSFAAAMASMAAPGDGRAHENL